MSLPKRASRGNQLRIPLTETCPICHKVFPTSVLLMHADECAAKFDRKGPSPQPARPQCGSVARCRWSSVSVSPRFSRCPVTSALPARPSRQSMQPIASSKRLLMWAPMGQRHTHGDPQALWRPAIMEVATQLSSHRTGLSMDTWPHRASVPPLRCRTMNSAVPAPAVAAAGALELEHPRRGCSRIWRASRFSVR